jgi:ABC-2 type transport system ATP-binding protein
MLQITNFSKTYQGRAVLRIESFAFAPGTYWVQGANGSGKSTLLQAIAGVTPFEGDIQLAGQLSVKKQAVAYRRLVNFAEAEPVFPKFLTGRELIRLFRAAKNGPPNQEDFYLESLQMGAYVHESVGTYSSGMLKKLSLVLAFLGQPTCVVLDDPLTTGALLLDSQPAGPTGYELSAVFAPSLCRRAAARPAASCSRARHPAPRRMTHPLTRVLLRVVARGFYQQHTGGLITLFLLVFINFFWTRVPNQSHLTAEQITQNGFRLVILSVSEPLGITLLLGSCFGYSLKSWHYVAGRLQRPDVQFLAYSSNALPWSRQVLSGW